MMGPGKPVERGNPLKSLADTDLVLFNIIDIIGSSGVDSKPGGMAPRSSGALERGGGTKNGASDIYIVPLQSTKKTKSGFLRSAALW